MPSRRRCARARGAARRRHLVSGGMALERVSSLGRYASGRPSAVAVSRPLDTERSSYGGDCCRHDSDRPWSAAARVVDDVTTTVSRIVPSATARTSAARATADGPLPGSRLSAPKATAAATTPATARPRGPRRRRVRPRPMDAASSSSRMRSRRAAAFSGPGRSSSWTGFSRVSSATARHASRFLQSRRRQWRGLRGRFERLELRA